MIVLVQITHLNQARFKFPTPQCLDNNQMPVGCASYKTVEIN